MSLSDLKLQLELETTSEDMVNWQIVSATDLSLGDVDIKCDNYIWQMFFDKAKPEILAGINYVFDFGQGVGLGLVDGANYYLRNNDNDWVLDLVGMPLNFTMTRYPEFSNEKDEISLNLDGQFVSDMAKEYVTPDSTWIEF